jgi:hypothetical protein
MYRSWGGTVINMSTLPEAKLAAEAEIAYQVILMSTDYDVRFLVSSLLRLLRLTPLSCPCHHRLSFPCLLCVALRCIAFGDTAFPFPFPQTTRLLILRYFFWTRVGYF